ncbi:hypothetical protein ASD64_09505 [Mesorhizobium sp. Root157]|nr:hypothetical protein ASD64_09505 [Mesorhizobium sp. Root157]
MAFSSISDIDLEKQVAGLSKELAALKKEMSKRGGAFYAGGRDAVSDYYTDIAERIGARLPDLRKRAKAIESSARDHPAATAAVGLAVLGLLVTLLFSRR